MKFSNCLLASDYDGTLYDDSGNIPVDVLEAIRYYRQNGGIFTVSTGRVARGFHAFDAAYINAPVLVANGAAAYDYLAGRYVFLSGIGREGLPLVHAVMTAFPQMSIEIYTLDRIFAIHMSKTTEHHFTSQDFVFEEIASPEEAPLPWCKVMLDAGEDSAAVQQLIGSFSDDPIFLPTTGSFVEILKRGVNKGTGLFRLADQLQIPYNRIFAVGDGYNDVDMLRAARFGFAPANGSREALAAADFVVRSNNEGALSHVIEILDGMVL